MGIEIKFRAWDYEDLQMYDDEQIIIQGGTVFIGKIKYIHQISDDVELMQYTGLKDKNGVEIYEGDILRLSDETNPLDYYQVKYVENFFALDGELAIHIKSAYFKEREVIGNIYENGDLLKLNKEITRWTLKQDFYQMWSLKFQKI